MTAGDAEGSAGFDAESEDRSDAGGGVAALEPLDAAGLPVAGDADVARARARLSEHERTVRDEQLARALDELDLSAAERARVDRLAARLAARIVAPPRRSLESADDPARVAAVLSRLLE